MRRPDGYPTPWRADRTGKRWWARRPVSGLVYDAEGNLVSVVETAELAEWVVFSVNSTSKAAQLLDDIKAERRT
jgi:hypothetical protein